MALCATSGTDEDADEEDEEDEAAADADEEEDDAAEAEAGFAAAVVVVVVVVVVATAAWSGFVKNLRQTRSSVTAIDAETVSSTGAPSVDCLKQRAKSAWTEA